ncbi:MAG: radical SAM protein [Pseudomonadota bacterium]|nr:radical SAM protein [Pseudomonadota bacterium]
MSISPTLKTPQIWLLNPPFLKKFSRPQRSPAVTKSGTLYFPMWLAYATAVLERAGYEVTLTDAPAQDLDEGKILALADDLAPDLIVLDTSTPSIDHDLEVAARIRRRLPNSLIVLVGTHVSATPEETLQNGAAIDIIARREYEETLLELANLLKKNKTKPSTTDLKKIKGISFRQEDNIIHNPDRPWLENLDDLPWVSPVYKKHLCIDDYFNQNAPHPMVTLITSRGCPHKCTFCVYPQTFTGRRLRNRSIDDIVDEISWTIETFPKLKSIFFEDDSLTNAPDRVRSLCKLIISRGLKIEWVANSRIELDLETMYLMKRAGCRELCVGFESGNRETLKKIRKGTSFERMFRFVSEARQAGILVHGCFMFGLPGETPASIEQTIDLAIRLRPDTAQFYPLMIYPGTEAYDEYRTRGWITAQSYRDWLTPTGLHNCVIRTETMTAAELVRSCDQARRRFYLRPAYIARKLLQMLQHPKDIKRTCKAAQTFFRHLFLGSQV